MRVVILNTNDISGGAARAAYRLHKGLRSLNKDSVMVVRHKQSNDPNVHQVIPQNIEYSIEAQIFHSIQQSLINQNRTPISNTLFSFPYPGYDISNKHVIKNTDIINLHWINNFQSSETIFKLLALGKPVIWTLHDQWPFTGGCHYSAGCEQYTNKCKACPQLKDNKYDIPFKVQQNKIRKYRKNNLTIVTPSKWLADCARKSTVFSDLRVEVIPNSIEIDVFKPVSKEQAKVSLGIIPDAITLLFGSNSNKSPRKGFDQLLKSILHCIEHDYIKKLIEKRRLNMLTFGKGDEELRNVGIPVISLGHIDSDEKLANIYSAADIFLLPSLEDNLPNTMLESMACGTPIVAFEVGGIPDVIQNGVTGYMAPCFSSDRFGDSMVNLITDESIRTQMSLNCRGLIENNFQINHQADKYLELFDDLLKDNKVNSKTAKYKCIANNSGKTFLTEWESDVEGDFCSVYREFAINLIRKMDEQIRKMDEQRIGRDKKISSIYNSYTYRIGRLIILPLQMIVRVIKKVFT